VCSSAASSILLQPTLPAVFHLGVSFIDASTAPVGEVVVADAFVVLVVLIRYVDLLVIPVFFDNLSII
jgi:hypothetical protein